MAEPQKRTPSFFKVLNGDFATLLRLPLLFTANYGKRLPEYSVLAIESGESWRVKIDEVEEHQCFTLGWAEFVKDLRLELHDFVIFWFECPSRFLVEVYGKNGPAKTLNPPVKGKVSPKIERDDDVFADPVPASADGVTEKKKRPCFSVDIKYINKYRLHIPSSFMRETGRVGSICVVLRDPGGREWPVLVSRHGKSRKDGSDMTKGWRDFKAGNDLVDGDICSFTHTETPGGWLLQVQVQRVNVNRTLSIPRPRGRPKREENLDELNQTKSLSHSSILLQNVTPVSYPEVPVGKSLESLGFEDDLLREGGAEPEIYTEEHEKLLGSTKMSWALFVDGYGEDGERIYDLVNGKTCHHCRHKTVGHCTHCSICNMVQGQFCGDCLYMRYGEHVLEANCNPDWICPVCRGICNCSVCRRAKGWAPTGPLYKKIKRLGYESVAHYLIRTHRANTNPENNVKHASSHTDDGEPSHGNLPPETSSKSTRKRQAAEAIPADSIAERRRQRRNQNN